MPTAKVKRVVAREAIVINVGGEPPVYHEGEVVNKRTGNKEVVPFTEVEPKDPGDLGVPYAFKEGQKVRENHPAVKANPSAFLSLEDAEAEGLVDD